MREVVVEVPGGIAKGPPHLTAWNNSPMVSSKGPRGKGQAWRPLHPPWEGVQSEPGRGALSPEGISRSWASLGCRLASEGCNFSRTLGLLLPSCA